MCTVNLLVLVLYTNIDQTLVNSLHRLLNCEIVKDKINLNATLSLISVDVHDLISMKPNQLFNVFYETRPAVQCFL